MAIKEHIRTERPIILHHFGSEFTDSRIRLRALYDRVKDPDDDVLGLSPSTTDDPEDWSHLSLK